MKRLPVLLAFLVALGLSAWASATYAEYEIDTSSQEFSIDVPTDGSVVRWTEDIQVGWAKPAMAGGDVLNGFVYIWNTADAALDDTALSNSTNDGIVDPNIDPPSLTKAAADFASDDSNLVRYLHIKTWYLDVSANQPTYSNDVVIGPINIDNVAPTGTVRITDDDGNDINATANSNFILNLAASQSPARMYINETNQRPGQGVAFAAEASYGLGDSDPGAKTIYAWFEDSVGNISSAPATDTVTLLAPVNISPYEPTLDLAATASQVFTVDGNSGDYNWEIIDETPNTQGEDVAGFSGASTETNSVTVALTNNGTFKIKATPTAGGDALTSGTIMVEKSSISKTFSLVTTEKTNVNTIGFILENTGIAKAHELGTAVGDCDLVSKWDEATQSYFSHPMAAPTYNDFDLEVGKAYFVSVTAAHDFTLTGTPPSSKSVSLVTTDKTNVNAIGLPKSKETLTVAHELGQNIGNVDLVSRWDVGTQSYLSHPMAAETYNNFTVEWGDGYFISVTQNTQWSW